MSFYDTLPISPGIPIPPDQITTTIERDSENARAVIANLDRQPPFVRMAHDLFIGVGQCIADRQDALVVVGIVQNLLTYSYPELTCNDIGKCPPELQRYRLKLLAIADDRHKLATLDDVRTLRRELEAIWESVLAIRAATYGRAVTNDQQSQTDGTANKADGLPQTGDDGGATVQTKAPKIGELHRLIPPLNTKSVNWIQANKKNEEKLGATVGTLRQYRSPKNGGVRSPDKMCGIDRKGRKWRHNGTSNSRVYYLIRSPPEA